jgi:hypothetical protein
MNVAGRGGFLRVMVRGLYPRRTGPYRTKNQALEILDEFISEVLMEPMINLENETRGPGICDRRDSLADGHPPGESESTVEKAEARLQKVHEELPEVYRKPCEVITTRMSARTLEVNHELRKIPTAG